MRASTSGYTSAMTTRGSWPTDPLSLQRFRPASTTSSTAIRRTGRTSWSITEVHRGRGARSLADAIPGTDALVTTVPGIVLTVMVADCVPLVLYDPVGRVLAVVHAGWGGTVRGVTTAAVETMRRLGSDPGDVVVGIGPSIAPDRYQVGGDVVDAASRAFGPRVDDVVRPDGTGAWTFDLWRANVIQLLDAGVPESGIHLAGLDTGRGTAYFSHRSEGPCGRFAVFARLRTRPLTDDALVREERWQQEQHERRPGHVGDDRREDAAGRAALQGQDEPRVSAAKTSIGLPVAKVAAA